MLVLGIESSCDETGCALVKEGRTILSNVIASQEEIHRPYGGVVPELACRRHVEVLPTLLDKALVLPLNEVDLIAVAHGPGLIGALLVGINFAKGLALSLGKPLVGVNHVEAHIYAALMANPVELPALGLIISGGHTALIKVSEVGHYELIGQTQDDAIGEAFDKVAKLLGLPYPGGPEIEKLSRGANPLTYRFKSGQIKGRPFDFSFSGLKTAVLYAAKGQNGTSKTPLTIGEEQIKNLAASFQHCALTSIVEKSIAAAQLHRCRSIIIGGGVSQNRYLRILFESASPLPLYWPAPGLSLDNGAMIAALGYHTFRRKGPSDMNLEPLTRIPWTNSS